MYNINIHIKLGFWPHIPNRRRRGHLRGQLKASELIYFHLCVFQYAVGDKYLKYNAKDVGIRGISIQHWLSNSSSSSTQPPLGFMRRVNQCGDRSKPNKVQYLRGLDGMPKKLTTQRKMQPTHNIQHPESSPQRPSIFFQRFDICLCVYIGSVW